MSTYLVLALACDAADVWALYLFILEHEKGRGHRQVEQLSADAAAAARGDAG